MSFSSRLPGRLESTEFSRTLDRLLEDRKDAIDLTRSDCTDDFESYRHKFEQIAADAAREVARQPYRPAPRGIDPARRAVAEYYRKRQRPVAVDDIYLTSSTSEAYSWLFKLHGDPGDTVLIPKPSYPLFEHLVRLEGLEPETYPLRYDGRWEIARGELDRILRRTNTDDCAALIAVSPNNPTGNYLTRRDLKWLLSKLERESLPLIVDEVFRDFRLCDKPVEETLPPYIQTAVPIYSLSGLSKVAGFPGAKVGWILARSTDKRFDESLTYIADNYLSVSSLAQHALPPLLEGADEFQQLVIERLHSNLTFAKNRTSEADHCDLYPVEGGWYAIVRYPATVPEDRRTLQLLRQTNVLVQPGFLYDLRPEAHFVVSLLSKPESFREGFDRVSSFLENQF